MLKRFAFFLIAVLAVTDCFAQIGGENAYEFLMIPASARAAYMGGIYPSIQDADLSLAYQNPSLLNKKMHHCISANQVFYPGNIETGMISYARYHNRLRGMLNTGIQFLNTGHMVKYDESGTRLGEFSAYEYCFFAGYAYTYAGRYTFGANTKLIYSQLDKNISVASCIDAGVTYSDTGHQFTASIVLKNAGAPFKNYTKGVREKLPFDLEIGIRQRLKHTPFSFIITAHNFYRFNIRYDDPNAASTSTIFGTDSSQLKPKKYVFDKIARHFIIGTELYFGKYFNVGLSYNHLRRAELAFESHKRLGGFSIGFGLHLRQMDIEYALAKYNASGASNNLTLNIRPGSFGKKGK